MNLITVVGARPQFIKAAAFSAALSQKEIVNEVLVHTGQHFDKNMSDDFVVELSIPEPTYNLGIGGLSHASMIGKMIEQLGEVFEQEKPDWVVVFGDTNSTLAAALAASKSSTKIAHIEAGLRSGNFAMPEEQNRVLTDRVSTLLLCPTTAALKNLDAEGFPRTDSGRRTQRSINVGDVMYDLYRQADEKGSFASLPSSLPGSVDQGDYIVCTIHRQENTDTPEVLTGLLYALEQVATTVPVVFVLHPRTKFCLERFGLGALLDSVCALPPVSYVEMHRLLRHASAVITDSGGLQKEAYFHRVPCVTVRGETEWVETVSSGANVLAEPTKDSVLDALTSVMQAQSWPPLYGDGDAASKIIDELLSY